MTDKELDAIKTRLRTVYEESPISPAEAAALDALVAEVERLREEAHELRLMVEEAARAENLNAEDAKRERAAVVAWLRRQWRSGWALTDAIERGEHRREEEG